MGVVSIKKNAVSTRSSLPPIPQPQYPLLHSSAISREESRQKLETLAVGHLNRVKTGNVRSTYLVEITHDEQVKEYSEIAFVDRSFIHTLREVVRDIYS